MTLQEETDNNRFSEHAAKCLLMLVLVFLRQVYLASIGVPEGAWSNPLVYLMLVVYIFCGAIVFASGAARASERRWFFRASVFALAIPWWIGFLYMIDGFFQLASIPYGIYKVADSLRGAGVPLSKLFLSWSFCWLVFSSLIA